MKKIVLFASGNGSNVENIIHYFKDNESVSVVGIFCNNPHAKVLDRAKNNNILSFVFSKTELNNGEILKKLSSIQPDLIVLAGFLLKFPIEIINTFQNKIINIHPALLPKYGGKGMYGMNVHNAVFQNNERETGITIHFLTENYDEGEFIFQQGINVQNCKTPEEIAEKVHELEFKFFPRIIETLIAMNL